MCGSNDLMTVDPWPFGRPGPRPDRGRNDFGAGLASPSDEGGFDEFAEDSFNLASRSAIRVRACVSRAVNSALRATRSSYDGSDDSADTARQPTSLHNRHPSRLTSYPVTRQQDRPGR
jgi:hypothetical protein